MEDELNLQDSLNSLAVIIFPLQNALVTNNVLQHVSFYVMREHIARSQCIKY